MKKKIMAGVMALLMVGALYGCGKATDNNLGKYNCTKMAVSDDNWIDVADLFGETSIELKEEGKALFTVEGDTVSGEYSIKGQELTLTIEGESITATISKGQIEMDLQGTKLLFEKEEAKAPDKGDSGEPGAPVTSEEVGKYTARAVDVWGDGEETPLEEANFGEAWLELKENNQFDILLDGSRNGSGSYTLEGENLTLDWSGVKYEGTCKDGEIRLDINTVIFIFEK